LAEKDDYISKLQHETKETGGLVNRQRNELDALQRLQEHQYQKVAAMAKDATRLQRHHAMGEWRQRVQAKLAQESADAAADRERRSAKEQISKLAEDNTALRNFIVQTEGKCRKRAAEMEQHQRHYDELLMEERLCVSAAHIGREAADEQKRSQIDELQQLEVRLRQEISRNQSRLPHANAYNSRETDALRHQAELVALTACMREISKLLGDPTTAGSGDELDLAMETLMVSLCNAGEEIPQVIRVGPLDYMIGNELVTCKVLNGQLNVQQFDGKDTIPMLDFIRQRSCRRPAVKPPSSMIAWPAGPFMPASPRNRSPPRGMPLQSAPSPGRSWGMPALVAPITIGGASEPVLFSGM